MCKWRVINKGCGDLSTHIQHSTNHQSICCSSSSRNKLRKLSTIQQFDGRGIFHPESVQFHFTSPIILYFHAILIFITPNFPCKNVVENAIKSQLTHGDLVGFRCTKCYPGIPWKSAIQRYWPELTLFRVEDMKRLG